MLQKFATLNIIRWIRNVRSSKWLPQIQRRILHILTIAPFENMASFSFKIHHHCNSWTPFFSTNPQSTIEQQMLPFARTQCQCMKRLKMWLFIQTWTLVKLLLKVNISTNQLCIPLRQKELSNSCFEADCSACKIVFVWRRIVFSFEDDCFLFEANCFFKMVFHSFEGSAS